MIEAVFISDLHLNPDQPEILEKFKCWLEWALVHTKSVYILGDFFHAWAGDDTLDHWSLSIAQELKRFAEKKIPVYFMHGNRDFLLGKKFAQLSGVQYLQEPCVIMKGKISFLLAHGDGYCTQDRKHQWYRRLTRNRIFKALFLRLPKQWRLSIVDKMRQQSRRHQSAMQTLMMETVPKALISHARKYRVGVIVHGHTHRPKMLDYVGKNYNFKQIILSDWEENPSILCYDYTKGFYFDLNIVKRRGRYV